MLERLKENWFVVLIALGIIGAISFYVYDTNKYNIKELSKNGQQIVATSDSGDVSADDLYTELSKNNDELLYNMYRNEVVGQSVKETDEMKTEAKKMADNITAYAKQQSADHYEIILEKELATYGYSSAEQLDDYCLMTVKQKSLNEKYVSDHFDELIKPLQDKNGRTISLLYINVTNPEELTEDEQKKKDNIDKSLAKQSFAETATAFSEDSTTAGNKGFYGYIDSSDSTLNQAVIEAATKLKKGETSDWITVTDTTTGASYLYRVYVEQTDIKTIYNSKNETAHDQLLYAIINYNNGLEETIVQQQASKLKIKFNNKDVQNKIEEYIKKQQTKKEETSDSEQEDINAETAEGVAE